MGHSHEHPAPPPKVAMLGAGLDQIKSLDASQSKLCCSFSELIKVTGMLLILPEWLSVVPRRQHQDKAITFRPRGSAAWCTHWNVRKPQELSCLPEGFDHISCLRLLCKALGSCKAAVYFLYLKKKKKKKNLLHFACNNKQLFICKRKRKTPYAAAQGSQLAGKCELKYILQ